MNKKIILLALIVAFLVFLAPVYAQENITANNTMSQFSVVVGNLTQIYNISGFVENSLNEEINDTNITWFLPYGVYPETSTDCNGTLTDGVSTYTDYSAVNSTHSQCTIEVGTVAASGGIAWANLTVKANISAFSSGYTQPFLAYGIANCSNACEVNTSNTSSIYGTSYWINPRPYSTNQSATNTSLQFTFWNQSDPYYEMWIPIQTYNETLGMPQMAENSFGDIIYANGSMIEMPGYMKLWSYNLSFKIDFPNEESVYYIIQSPVNNSVQKNETLFPLYVINETMSGPEGNFTALFARPAEEGFHIWVNGTRYNQTTITSQLGTIVNYNPEDQQILFNATNSSINNSIVTMMFTVMYFDGTIPSPTSPIYVDYQNLTGFDFMNPPNPDDELSTLYFLNISNKYSNYTLENLRLNFFSPINVTFNETQSFNMTSNLNVTWWNGSAYTNNSTIITNGTSTANFQDNVEGSPCPNCTINVTFMTVNVTLDELNNWLPQSSTNASIRMTSNMTFPIMNESNSTPNTAGSVNTYNASLSMPMEGRINLTNKTSGIGCSDTIVFRVDGQPQGSGNYSCGSFEATVGSGSHTVSVSWTKGSASSNGGGGGGGRAGPSESADYEFEEGEAKDISMSAGDSFSFSVAGGEIYSFELSKLVGTTATILIGSDLMTITMSVFDTMYVDLDSDGYNDISVTLNKIKQGVADFTVTAFEVKDKTPVVEEQAAPVSEEAPAEVITEEVVVAPEVVSWGYAGSGIVVIVILITAGYWYGIKK